MTLKEQIVDFIEVRNGGVSFAEFDRYFSGFKGDMEYGVSDKNLVFWSGASKAFLDALLALREENSVFVVGASALVYVIDGVVPALPQAKRDKAYKKPHWCPVVFYTAAQMLKFGLTPLLPVKHVSRFERSNK